MLLDARGQVTGLMPPGLPDPTPALKTPEGVPVATVVLPHGLNDEFLIPLIRSQFRCTLVVRDATRINVTLNGVPFTARKGELIIAAAERGGVYIPRFCYHPRMKPVGMCRQCIVEVDTGRGPALMPSCMFPVAPDMKIDTESATVKRVQEGVLELLLPRPVSPGQFYNVNFPALNTADAEPEIIFAPLDPNPLPLSYRHEEGLHYYEGDYHNRTRKPGADVDVCFGGRIAVTKVRLL